MKWQWIMTAMLATGLAACNEMQSDPTRPRPTRAVASPVETNSEENEVLGPPEGALPIVTVVASNKQGQPPEVHTIVDDVRNLGQPAPPPTETLAPATLPATQPTPVQTFRPGEPTATQPATIPAPRLHVDPVTGE